MSASPTAAAVIEIKPPRPEPSVVERSRRILLAGDYPNDPRLGSAKVPHKLAEEFRRLGHHCDLLFADDLGLKPVGMHLRHAAGPWLAAWAIARRVRTNGPYDVIDAASGEGLAVPLLRKLRVLPRGTAFVSRSHGLEHLNYRRMIDDHRAGLAHKPWYKRIIYPANRLTQVALAAKTADQMIVLNEADRDFVLARGWKGPGEVAVVPHGVSQRFLDHAPPPDAPRGKGILFCGTWTAVKGTDYLPQAFALLLADGLPAVNLTILGGHLPAATILPAFPTQCKPHVTVVERVAEDLVMEEYARHDLLVFPSTYEGFGMVVPEAMSQRLPVVAAPVGCAPSLILDGVTGWIVPPRDPARLAQTIRLALSDVAARRRVADAAFEVVANRSWTETARRTLEVYEEALQGRAALVRQ